MLKQPNSVRFEVTTATIALVCPSRCAPLHS